MYDFWRAWVTVELDDISVQSCLQQQQEEEEQEGKGKGKGEEVATRLLHVPGNRPVVRGFSDWVSAVRILGVERHDFPTSDELSRPLQRTINSQVVYSDTQAVEQMDAATTTVAPPAQSPASK